MSKIKVLWKEFFSCPLRAIGRWQNYRPIWIIMGGTALIMNLIAHYIFQIFMELDPCELCVYIRFSMFTIFFGALIVVINPKNNIFRWFGGYLLAGYGIIQGLIWDIKLEKIHIVLKKIESGVDFFAAGGGSGSCSTTPSFPLSLPLDVWFPSWFSPTGSCGEVDWYLFGFNMAECLFLFYGIYLLALIFMVISWFRFRNTLL